MPSRLCISSRDRGRKGSVVAEAEAVAVSIKSGLETEEECRDLGMLRRALLEGQDGRGGARGADA